MVSSVKDSQAPSILADLSSQSKSPSGSEDSFTAELTSALEGGRLISAERPNPAPGNRSTQSQDSGVRQFPATVLAPESAPQAITPAATPDSTGATFFGFVSTPAVAASATTGTAADTSGDASSTTGTAQSAQPMNEMDAYWAAQPAPVQELRNITDITARGAKAQDLANQGYTIDKAIMVWGWDPLKTMLTRQMYGYTWAPNINQGNVPTPGLTLPGQTAYDPKNPMPGSIAVNTNFAKGTTIVDPWCASQLKSNT
jgi:hypothetical protein